MEPVLKHGHEMRCILILMVAIMAGVSTRCAGEEGAIRPCRGDEIVVQAVGNPCE